jgi:hypothetical protein
MKKFTLISLLILSFSQVAVAAPNTSDIQIGSGSMGPKSTLSFTLADLAPNVSYYVYCDISANLPADVDVYTNSMPAYLDGKQAENVLKLKLDHYSQGYKLKAAAQNYMQNIVFTNLDDKATVNLSNCVAKVN